MSAFIKTVKQKLAVALFSGSAMFILLFGGSRSGKTMVILWAIVVRAMSCPGSRHLILRLRFNHVKISIWYDTLPKVLKLACPQGGYKFNKSDWFVEFRNGSQIWIGGLDDKERTEKILGNEYATIFFNECSQMLYDSITTALTRLAQKTALRNKAYFDCNPPSPRHWSHQLFIEKLDPDTNEPKPPDLYASMLINPDDNRENLPDGYIENTLASLPERKRKRFMFGMWLEDNENALWRREWIDRNRLPKLPEGFNLKSICVGVDPAVTSNPDSDETGIIVSGSGKALPGMAHQEKEHFYVMGDYSLRGTPAEWAREVSRAYTQEKADKVIGETNNGGDLIESNIRTVSPNIPYKGVHASRGKYTRAEPISTLYEEGRVHHVGVFPELEDELCNWEPTEEKSPNRLDALVWSLTHLSGPVFEFTRIEGVGAI